MEGKRRGKLWRENVEGKAIGGNSRGKIWAEIMGGKLWREIVEGKYGGKFG